MNITFKHHNYHSDTATVHTLCGGYSENRDLLMRKIASRSFMIYFSMRRSTAWIPTFISKVASRVLLGRKCLDCKRRAILGFSKKGNICFCLDNISNT
jgi:hypothetical protein